MSRDFLRSPLVGLLACLLALVVAMGVGRFSLTPQLPHLIREGQLDLTGAALAAANYLGYLVGALDALFARERGRRACACWSGYGPASARPWPRSGRASGRTRCCASVLAWPAPGY